MTTRIENLGANKVVIHTSGVSVLYSYNTPVAAYILGAGYFKTEKYHSVTTSKHINLWLKGLLNGSEVKIKPQTFFDDLIK